MIVHVLEAIAWTGAAFGLGWYLGSGWERAGREVDRLTAEHVDELRALPRVPPHEPPGRLVVNPPSAAPYVPQWEWLRLVPGPRPVLPPPGPSPIFDQLAAEFERRVHPADEALAAALAAGAEFVAGLDSWADGARALIRGTG